MKAGTASEIREVWKEHAGPLGHFIARRVKGLHDADDILQEVFLKTHAAFARGRKPERLKPWLYSVAEHAIADHHRGRARAALLLVTEQNGHTEEAAEPGNVNGEVASCLRPMIEELPEGYRRALVLADLEGKKGREVPRSSDCLCPGRSRACSGRGGSSKPSCSRAAGWNSTGSATSWTASARRKPIAIAADRGPVAKQAAVEVFASFSPISRLGLRTVYLERRFGAWAMSA